MLRFIANFILFGVLFYLIATYFPDQFQTLIHWAEAIVNFVKDTAHMIMEKLGSGTTAPPPTT